MMQCIERRKDSVTGLEMVLSDCTFKEACTYLEKESSEGALGHYLGTFAKSGVASQISFENRNYLFDEERKVLLLINRLA